MNLIRIIIFRKSPHPLFTKEGLYSSLWQREVRRDFIKQCYYNMPGLFLREV